MRTKLIIVGVILLCTFSLKAQNLWNENGVAVRQGKHIEWYRSADNDTSGYLYATWSDCRTGTRDIYAQKYDRNGNPLWTEGGVQVVEADERQEDPVIVADGSGGAIIAWVDVISDPKCNVYCQRLDSGGNKVWSSSGLLVHGIISAYSPANITADGSGGAIITWKDARNAVDGDIYAVKVTPEGERAAGWEENGVAVCREAGEQSGASIGPDGSGGAFITWKDKRSGTNYDIYAQRVLINGDLSWTDGGLLICGATGDQDQVKLWTDGDNGAIVIWRDRRSGSYTDIYAQRINGAGLAQWTPQGHPVCTAEGNQEEPRLVHDGHNGAVFTWKDHRNSPYDWDIYAQRVNGDGSIMWSPEDVAVCAESGDQIEVRLTLSSTSDAVFVWVDQRDEGSPLGDIYVQRVSSDGTILWTDGGQVVCAAPSAQFSPLVRSDGQDGIYAIWGDQRTGSIQIFSQHVDQNGTVQWDPSGRTVIDGISGNATHLQVSRDEDGVLLAWEDGRRGSFGTYVYTQKVDGTGSVLWDENGTGADTSGNGNQTGPAIASDGAGGAIIAWEDRRFGTLQIFAQRITSQGVHLWTQAVQVSETDNDQENVTITPDGEGGAIIAWSDLRDGMDFDVYVQRIDSQGSILWDAGGIRLSTSDYDEYAYGVITAGDGGALVLWQGGSWNNQDIYMQKIDSDGTVAPGWVDGGLTVCDASGHQVEPVLISDGQSGAIIVWEDSRNGPKDIFAQRVSADGVPLWTVSGEDSLNGLPVCRAQNDQSSPSLSSSTNAGCFVAWHDFRNIDLGNDIYAQKISGQGDVLWNDDGNGFSLIEGDQFSPVLISDESEEAVIIWEDNRSSESKLDIYGQSMNASGSYGWDENGAVIVQYYHKQSAPKVAPDGEGGGYVTWEDMRSSGKSETHDIYAQRVQGASRGLRGDVTDDGNINVLDVLGALNHILNVIPLDENGQWRADCNGDGAINVLDALGIANVILGLGSCSPSW